MAPRRRTPSSLRRKWGRNISRRRVAFNPLAEPRGPNEPAMSQCDLAEHMGTNQSTVSRWEAGLVEPTLERKLELAALLRTDVEILFPLIQPDIYEPGRRVS